MSAPAGLPQPRAELTARAANVLGAPVSHPWGLRDFRVLDRDGNCLAFAQPFG